MNQFQNSEGEPGHVESGIPQSPARPSVGLVIACNLDLVVLLLSLPVFIAASLPMVAWGVAAGVWLLQRAIQIWVNRRAAASKDPRTVVGLLAGSMLGRAWLVAIAIFLVGVNDNTAGLAAAVLIIALFTVYFTMGMVMRPLAAADAQARQAAAAAAAGATAPPTSAAAGTTTAPTAPTSAGALTGATTAQMSAGALTGATTAQTSAGPLAAAATAPEPAGGLTGVASRATVAPRPAAAATGAPSPTVTPR